MILIGSAVVSVLLLILLISGAVHLISKGLGAITGGGKDSSSSTPASSVSEIESSSQPDEDSISWSSVQLTEADEHQGDLILVNALHEYRSEPEDLLIFYGNKTRSYGIKVAEMYAKSSVVSAMNEMMDAFAAATGNSSALLDSAYRDVTSQQTLYNNDLASTGETTSSTVAAPGASEHHTGYALDLSYQSNVGYQYIDGTGDYAWIAENCWKYGFIIRYTDDKEAITGYPAEWWHVRFVGKTIAWEIHNTGMAYEEFYEKCADGFQPETDTAEESSADDETKEDKTDPMN